MISIAYRTLGAGLSPTEVAKRLKNVKLEHEAKAISEMRKDIYKVSRQCAKWLPKGIDDTELLFPLVWKFFQKKKLPEYLKKKSIFPAAQKFEEREKESYIEVLLQSKKEGMESVLYLASSHDDCAEDHLDYQGKIYCDAKWRTREADPEIKKRIADFIQSHDIKSLQWVTRRPVWFCTRPNCRHYFVALGTEEALTESISTLKERYRTHHQVGPRGGRQTIYHPTNKSWYTKSNIETTINQYRERLRLHIQLNEEHPTPELAKEIKKDRYLIQKWLAYLKKEKM